MKKKILAFLLTVLLVLSCIPCNIAFADRQTPVRADSVRIVPGSSDDGNYTFDLTWTAPNPQPSGVDDGSYTIGHLTEGYEIYYRNATRNQAFTLMADGTILGTQPYTGPDAPATEYNFTNMPLGNPNDRGSLYVFEVRPFHRHQPPTPPGGTPPSPIRANPTLTTATPAQAIFMTDLNVYARYENGQLIIEWDNPLYNGQEIITNFNYTISLQGASGATVRNIDITKDQGISGIGTDRLSLTISNPGLDFATYEVSLWPNFTSMMSNNVILFNVGENRPRIPGTWSGRHLSATVNVRPGLTVSDYSAELIKLTWTPYSAMNYSMDAVLILRGTAVDEDGNLINPEIIGRYEDKYMREVNTFFISRSAPDFNPDAIYQIRFMLSDGTFVLSDSGKTPPITADYLPYIPTVYDLQQTAPGTPSADMTWLAFMREKYGTDTEFFVDLDGWGLGDNIIVDQDIYYTLWVTDNPDNFNSSGLQPVWDEVYTPDADFISSLARYNFTPEILRPVYNKSVSQYYSSDDFMEPKDMELGKTYYFRLIAVKVFPNGERKSSYAAYYQIYLPTEGDVSNRPVMLDAPPLRIKSDTSKLKLSNGDDFDGSNALAIEWDEKWIEAYDARNNRWHSYIAVEEKNGVADITFDTLSGLENLIGIDKYNYKESEAAFNGLREALTTAGVADVIINNLAVRQMDITGMDYEIHTVAYNELLTQSPESYVMKMLPDEPGYWSALEHSPCGDPAPCTDVTEYSIVENDWEGNPLNKGTSYVIFVRPRKPNAYPAYYPAFIVGTTDYVSYDPPVDPTWPTLEVIPELTTGTSITVRFFEYVKGVAYDLYYSEDPKAHENDAGWPEPEVGGEPYGGWETEPDDPKTVIYTFENMFPDTTFYFWVVARSQDDPEKPSKKSNQDTETTKDLEPPPPPNPFGPASQYSVDLYNREADPTPEPKIKPAAPDYFVLEWGRVDSRLDITEITEDVTGLNSESLLTSLRETLLTARFFNLDSNTTYYARAKTVLTLTKSERGRIAARNYSYVVQISTDETFEDIVAEITIPPIEEGARRWESVWVTCVIHTDPSGDGFDKDERNYPLPNKNYEVLYDDATKTLTFRLRSNEKDAMGNNDNLVDQRFIGDLVKNGNFTYEIDLSSYEGREIATREVVIPYSIIKAFDERKVSLNVIANTMSVTIMPGTYDTVQVKALKDFGGLNSRVKITIAEASSYPELSYKENYANVPQKVSLTVITPTRTVNMTNTAVDMKINLKLFNRFLASETNIGAYVSDANTGGWQRLDGTYNSVSGIVSVNSKKLANFAAISVSAPVPINRDNSLVDDTVFDNAIKVNSKLDIRDLAAFNPDGAIHANQFNQIILALSKNSRVVNINTPLMNAQISELSKAGMLVSGNRVSREAGIAVIVKLYENKVKPVRTYPKASDSFFPDINTVSAKYLTPMLKAEQIGFLDRFETLSPKKDLTFADVFYMIDILIDDAGM